MSITGNTCFGQDGDVVTGIWPLADQNIHNTGVNPYENILNVDNVSQLIKGWDTYEYGTDLAVSGAPSVSNDNVIYYGDSQGNVYALNAKTGAQIWKTTIPNQYFLQSPALTTAYLYIGYDTMYCLDRFTGAVIWSTPANTGPFPYFGSPTVVEDLVIVGVGSLAESVAPPPYTSRGAIIAFNRFNGDIAWEYFNTSDQTSPHPQYGPGQGSYSTAGIDIDRHLAFIGTGQAYSGTAGPTSDSLLALDYYTGELVWHYQFTANDVWNSTLTPPPGTYDHDVANHPNLFSLELPIFGNVDFVGVGDKGGHYKIFTRDQNPNNVCPIVELTLDPGSQLGALQGCAVVYDGVLYVSSEAYLNSEGQRLSLDYLLDPTDTFQQLLNLIEYGSVKTIAFDIKKLIEIGNTHGAIPQEAVLWTNITPGNVQSNPLSFANGVLYQASWTGWVRALDAKTGNELWRDTPVPVIDPVNLPLPALIPTGVTVADGMLYIGVGADELGSGLPIGGIFSYQLPD